MNIVVNTRLLLKNKLEGIGWFSYETLKRITTQHPEHQFIFFFDRPFSEEFIFSSNIKPVVIAPPTRHPFLWYLWLEQSVPKNLMKHGARLFFSPDGFLSLSSPVPSVPVIHDINFVHRPQDLPYFTRKFYNTFFPIYAQKAHRIITVSEYSKNDICKSYNIEPSKIDVVYNGSNSLYNPIDEETKKRTKNTYSKGSDYFIFIGSLHPRKNIARLLEAFEMFKKSTSSSLKLLIVGEAMFKTKDIQKIYSEMSFKDDVIFTGRLSPEDLRTVLGSALALTFVPYFEGFGIPILEAMYANVPVIASNVTSMPEVAGNAAIYADPFSVDSIKDAMLKMANDITLRADLIEKAKEQRQKFSWDKTADKVWNSIETALNS